MVDIGQKTGGSRKQIIVVAAIGMIFFAVSGLGYAWAETNQTQTDNTQIKASDSIKNNPTAMKILNNIELFKKNYAAIESKKQLEDQQQQFIDQQRKIANEYLQADLAQMDNANSTHSPKNAYAGFVSTVNNSTKNLFWDEYNYAQQKITNAKLAMSQVLQNGGSKQDALNAYYEAAAMHKSELVSINLELNLKHHLADAKTQDLFNSLGSSITRT
jgi:hypothetical protein